MELTTHGIRYYKRQGDAKIKGKFSILELVDCYVHQDKAGYHRFNITTKNLRTYDFRVANLRDAKLWSFALLKTIELARIKQAATKQSNGILDVRLFFF